jgi:hypothetical protein
MDTESIRLTHSSGRISLYLGEAEMAVDLGVGIPLNGHWWWSFDGTLRHGEPTSESGSDLYGDYYSLDLTYHDDAGPLVQLRLKTYPRRSWVIAETTALKDLQGTFLEDSFSSTTFNAPVVRPADRLHYLTYTWGLQGQEGVGIGGHFPDGVAASDLGQLPEALRRAGFSPTMDLHRTTQKPFAPLVAYDEQERTLVMSPLDHFLISPMRLMDTPAGAGVARGLHGAVDVIRQGAITRTALVMGRGVAATMFNWGDLLLQQGGKSRGSGRDSNLVSRLGFWNCYGSYYAELFRQTNEETLLELARYYQSAEIPVRYIGLDLWYHFREVGFAHDYRPDPAKYPRGLKPIIQETGLPMLLHMSAFDADTAHREAYEFVVDEGSSYPVGPHFYRDRAREYRDWGSLGIWPDFLRTQIQNSRSLRAQLGMAEVWFDGLCRAMYEQGLDVMLCMPTVGHYLASTAYPNVNSVRTSTDYVNHQPGQLEILSRTVEEYRIPNTSQHNLRQNLLVSLLAGSLGLAPSYDVFITNQDHPEGFAEAEAPKQALARALSGGIVGIGDKVGHVDRSIVDRLAFPDGILAQPDHPPFPVVSTLEWEAPAFYTTTSIGDCTWTYLAVYNLGEVSRDYRLDLAQFQESHSLANEKSPQSHFTRGDQEGLVVYDYLDGRLLDNPDATDRALLQGTLEVGGYRYLVLPPRIGGLHLLGFLDKYVTVSQRQVKGVALEDGQVVLDLTLPPAKTYTFSVLAPEGVRAQGRDISEVAVQQRDGLHQVTFRVDAPQCRLVLEG